MGSPRPVIPSGCMLNRWKPCPASFFEGLRSVLWLGVIDQKPVCHCASKLVRAHGSLLLPAALQLQAVRAGSCSWRPYLDSEGLSGGRTPRATNCGGHHNTLSGFHWGRGTQQAPLHATLPSVRCWRSFDLSMSGLGNGQGTQKSLSQMHQEQLLTFLPVNMEELLK